MSSQLLFLLLPILAAAILTYLTYTYLLHPLRHIPPAHFTSPLTPLWIRHHRRGGSQAIPAITRAHAIHGPLVRLGPTELSVSSYAGAHKVYIDKGGFAKPKWWADSFTTYDVRNLVSMQGGPGGPGGKAHAARKRDLGGVYAKSRLFGGGELGEAVGLGLRGLGEVLGGGGVLDVFGVNGAVSADCASGYLYGGATGFARDVGARDEYYEYHGAWLEGKPGADEAKVWLEGFGVRQCDGAERRCVEGKDGAGAVVYKQLRSRGLEGACLASELLDHFVASAEAPRTTLTYLQWELSKRPGLQQRLRDEILGIVPRRGQPGDVMDALLDFKAVDALPLLDAVLVETLRVYTPTPGPQYRITPAEGTTLHGVFIPGGVEISSCLSVLHRNRHVFPEPARWNPDRWLTADEKELEEMRRWSWAFLKGSRVCIGKDFAVFVMKSIIAAIYVQYSTCIVDDEGMEQEDKFLAGPVMKRLILSFSRIGV